MVEKQSHQRTGARRSSRIAAAAAVAEQLPESNTLPALDESSGANNSSHGPSSEEESLSAVDAKKPKPEITTTEVLAPDLFRYMTESGLEVKASGSPLQGIEDAVRALNESAKQGGLVRLVEATQLGGGPLKATKFRHGWKLEYGESVGHAYESEPANGCGPGVVVTHVPLLSPPQAIVLLFADGKNGLPESMYETYEVLVYVLGEGDKLIGCHHDYYHNKSKRLLEISCCYFELNDNGQEVKSQDLHSKLRLMTGNNEALAISCSSYIMSGPGLYGWEHERIRTTSFDGVGVAVVRRRWEGHSCVDKNVLWQWESLYRSQALDNAQLFSSVLSSAPQGSSALAKFVHVFKSMEFKSATFPGKYAPFDAQWAPPEIPKWFGDFGGWQRVGNGGPGTTIYDVATMYQARSLAQTLHWHEQPQEAFHHRNGAVRSGVVELGTNGNTLEGTTLKTTLRVFSGQNATKVEMCVHVAISTFSLGKLRFEGFFKLDELGEASEGSYQVAVFKKL